MSLEIFLQAALLAGLMIVFLPRIPHWGANMPALAGRMAAHKTIEDRGVSDNAL